MPFLTWPLWALLTKIWTISLSFTFPESHYIHSKLLAVSWIWYVVLYHRALIQASSLPFVPLIPQKLNSIIASFNNTLLCLPSHIPQAPEQTALTTSIVISSDSKSIFTHIVFHDSLNFFVYISLPITANLWRVGTKSYWSFSPLFTPTRSTGPGKYRSRPNCCKTICKHQFTCLF